MKRERRAPRIPQALGLALIAALMLSAAVAVAPASAKRTVLCQVNEAVCSKGKTWSSGAELTGFVGNPGSSLKLELPKLTSISCEQSKFGTVLNEVPESAMSGEVDRWPFLTPCTPSGCVILTSPAEAPMGYAAQLEAVGGGDGVLRVSNPVLIARCIKSPLTFECKYTATTAEFQVEGGGEIEGEHAYISSEAPLVRVTGACPVTAIFHSHYEIYEPGSAVYVTN